MHGELLIKSDEKCCRKSKIVRVYSMFENSSVVLFLERLKEGKQSDFLNMKKDQNSVCLWIDMID